MPSLIGNKPNQVPSNGDLGTLAFQDASNVIVGNANVTGVTTVQAGSVSAPAITTTGDTNTGIFFPAADTIAFTEGGVEAMRIDSSGNVGIGNSSPTNFASATTLTVNNAGDGVVNTQSNGTNGLRIGSGSSSSYLFEARAVPMRFLTDSTERMRIDSSGRVLVGLTSANTSGANLQVSQGITFPATQSASSDANTLDDYEEGTFTPTFGSEFGAFTSVAYLAQSGRYVKIGKTVYVNILVGWSAFVVGTGTGNVQIKGLPFVAADFDALFTTETLDINWPNAGTVAGQSNADTNIFFRVSQNNGQWNTILVSAQGAAETNYIRLSGTYLTT